MLKNIMPVFNSGEILTKEMLDNLRDFPRDIIEIFYNNYSDGIISGFDIEVIDTNVIKIRKGILKHKGVVYTMADEPLFSLNEFCKEEDYIVVEFEHKNEYEHFGEIKIKKDYDSNKEFLLGSFYRDGDSKISSDYERFDSINNYNKIKIIDVEYSYEGLSSLSPKITALFAREILKKSKDSIDFAFSYLCLQNKVISRDNLINYINYKSSENYTEMTNKEIYAKLSEILKGIKSLPEKANEERKKSDKIIIG